MIDIYGDSTLIIDSFDKCNILIDTGETDESNKVVNYIKSKHIKRLDYVIITHSHNDHNGELKDITEEFNIVNLIQVNKYESLGEVKCGSLKLNFFDVSIPSSNPNEQSLVNLITLNDTKFLFTGDIEESNEVIFSQKYHLDIDYLKSPHHGSKTSSSTYLLDSVNTENVLISSYRYNTHGHPNNSVIDRYNDYNINVYRTDELGTIEIKYFLGYEFKKFHKP